MHIFLDANICLDLLDTTRPTSSGSIAWYMQHKDDTSLHFYFCGDFITTFYYILTERRKIDKLAVVQAIDALSMEVLPLYLNHTDFIAAKNSFYDETFDDFEDLMVLHTALRGACTKFMTNDSALLELNTFDTIQISRVTPT